MKQHLFWFYSPLLVYGRPPVKDYRIDAWETGREAVFPRKYYKRSVKVGSGKNSSCHSAPQRQPWLLPGSLYNPYHLPIWAQIQVGTVNLCLQVSLDLFACDWVIQGESPWDSEPKVLVLYSYCLCIIYTVLNSASWKSSNAGVTLTPSEGASVRQL